MDEYQLQTEINDETQRRLVRHSEKLRLQTEIEEQRGKISKSFRTSAKVFSLLIVVNVLLSFIWQRPADFFVVTIYGVAYLIEILWLMFGLRKRQRKLVEWENVADERQYENL